MSKDLIVTHANDSIYCNIINKQGEYLFITKIVDNKKVDDRILRSNVKSIEYVSDIEFDNYMNKDISKKSVLNNNHPDYIDGLEFSIQAGLGYLTAGTPKNSSSEEEKIFDDIKKGLDIKSALIYNFYGSIGLGAEFQLYHSSTNIGTGKHTHRTWFIGPIINYRYKLNSSLHFYGNLSIGLAKFSQRTEAGDDYLEFYAYTPGSCSNIGIDFILSDNKALSIGIGSFAGRFKGVTEDSNVSSGVDTDEAEIDLGRVSISLGFKFSAF
jgi:hypothetical protein